MAGGSRNGKSRSPTRAGDEVVSLISGLALTNSSTVAKFAAGNHSCYILLNLES